MPANCMLVQIEGVDLEIEPIEGKRLDKTHDSFPKESVDPNGSDVLVK